MSAFYHYGFSNFHICGRMKERKFQTEMTLDLQVLYMSTTSTNYEQLNSQGYHIRPHLKYSWFENLIK